MKVPKAFLVATVVAVACGKKVEPAPAEPGTAAAGSTPTPTSSAKSTSSRLPEWTFDPEDPARDYVGRYLRATLRYGDDTSCVVLGRSSFRGRESVVEVRNPAEGSCGKAAELRDTFLASVASDHLRLDDPEHRPALKPWPDGSLPDGPAAPVTEVRELHSWKSPIHDVIKKQQLYPVRVQLYGRGTYPVITLAGWHALFDPKGDLSALSSPAADLCAASHGAPMGFLAGLDRKLLLRIDCPDRVRWENLGL